MLLRNVGTHLPIYTASYLRRPKFCYSTSRKYSLFCHLVRLWLKLLAWVLVKGYRIWVQLSIANEFWKRCWSVWVSVVFCGRPFMLVYKPVPERSKSDDRPWHGPAKCLNHYMQHLVHDSFPCSPIVHVAACLSRRISQHSKSIGKFACMFTLWSSGLWNRAGLVGGGKRQRVHPERCCPSTRLQHGVTTPKKRIRIFATMETSCHAFVFILKYHGV